MILLAFCEVNSFICRRRDICGLRRHKLQCRWTFAIAHWPWQLIEQTQLLLPTSGRHQDCWDAVKSALLDAWASERVESTPYYHFCGFLSRGEEAEEFLLTAQAHDQVPGHIFNMQLFLYTASLSWIYDFCSASWPAGLSCTGVLQLENQVAGDSFYSAHFSHQAKLWNAFLYFPNFMLDQ